MLTKRHISRSVSSLVPHIPDDLLWLFIWAFSSFRLLMTLSSKNKTELSVLSQGRQKNFSKEKRLLTSSLLFRRKRCDRCSQIGHWTLYFSQWVWQRSFDRRQKPMYISKMIRIVFIIIQQLLLIYSIHYCFYNYLILIYIYFLNIILYSFPYSISIGNVFSFFLLHSVSVSFCPCLLAVKTQRLLKEPYILKFCPLVWL